LDKHEDNPPRSIDQAEEKPVSDKKQQKRKRNRSKSALNWKWALKAALLSIFISVLLTLLSTEVLEKLNLVAAFIILIIFIIINIFFDILAISITKADIKPFHSMSARRLKVGYMGVYLINNAEKMNNIFADVIGDIAGVVSGATGTAIIIKLFTSPDSEFTANLIITSLIAGLTVGGKALGKSIGMKYSYNFVYGTAKVLSLFSKRKTNEKKEIK
jgi:hypothetical protein